MRVSSILDIVPDRVRRCEDDPFHTTDEDTKVKFFRQQPGSSQQVEQEGGGGIQFACHYRRCKFSGSTSALAHHIASSHSFRCEVCKVDQPSERMLDLHVLERHDTLFSLMKLEQPSYLCWLEGCEAVFWNASERKDHLLDFHKYPQTYFTANHQQLNSAAKKPKKPLCRYFKRGYCRTGDDCRFKHVSLIARVEEVDDDDTSMDVLTNALEKMAVVLPTRISFGRRGRSTSQR